MKVKNKSRSKYFTNSLSFKQARIAVIAGFVLGIGFSVIQITIDMRSEIRQVDSTFKLSLMAFEESAFQAAFGLDKVLAQNVVNGLFQQTAVIEAKIIDSYGDTMYSKSRPLLQNSLSWLAEGLFGESKSYFTPLKENGTGFHAGDLSIRVDTNVIAKSFFQRSGLILTFGILRNVFLAVILALLFHKILTKPLREIAIKIREGSTELTVSEDHENDELGDIVIEYNRLSQYRAEAEVLLREEERRYRGLFENSEVSIWNQDYSEVIKTLNELKRNGVIDFRRYLNDNEDAAPEMAAMIKIYSVNLATMKLFEASSTDQFFQQIGNTFGPNAIEVFKNQLCAIWDKQTIFRAEAVFRTLKGREITGVISLPIPETEDGFRSIPVSILDITEFKKAETELSFRGEVIEGMAEGVQATRMSDGVIIYTNAMFDTMFGYDSGELVGKPVGILNAETDQTPEKTAELIIADIKAKGSWLGEIQNVKKNGSSFWCEASVTTFNHPKHGTLAIAVHTDITKRKITENQLRQAQRMEAIGQLTGGVAHDFNNLMAVMMGNLEFALDNVEDDTPVRKFIENALGAIDSGSALTQKLLSFSRQQTLSLSVLDVNGLIDDTINLLRRTLGEDIAINTKFNDEQVLINIDPSIFSNALLNLSLNARDAMSKGGSLSITTSSIHFDGEQIGINQERVYGPYVMIAVSDTGVGIDKEDINKVMEPFFTTKKVGEGTGLGLSMVYGFIQQSNGHVGISSKKGEGTTISLYVPIAQEEHAEQESEPYSYETIIENKTILVVEDNPDVRETTSDTLKHFGYKVIEAEDGPSALSILNEAPEQIDLVFSDVVMPNNMSGLELAEHIAAEYKEIKVLLTSGYPDKIAEYEDIQKLNIKLLAKPYKRAQLIAAIENTCD